MNLKNQFAIAAALYGSATLCMAQSAWLPECGELKATPGFSFSTFDEFWAGGQKVDNPPNGDSLKQYTGYLSLEMGIFDNLAADATFGYTATDTDAFGMEDDSGMMDTSLGLRYRLLDERTASQRWIPTIAVRVGGIIPGTYEENLPFSPGDGAYGFDASLLLGKTYWLDDTYAVGYYGDIGYRVRVNPAPNEIFGTAGLFGQLGPVTLTAGYLQVQSLSGLDIDSPKFNPAAGKDSGFPALREINYIFQGGITYTDPGRRSYQFTVAKSIHGRNTGDKLIFGFNVTLPFGPFRL